jgi:hypothetical protein
MGHSLASTVDLKRYLSSDDFALDEGVYVFDKARGNRLKLNRINVLEDLGRGRVWKNVFAHYYRFLFVMRWLRPRTLLVDMGCG